MGNQVVVDRSPPALDDVLSTKALASADKSLDLSSTPWGSAICMWRFSCDKSGKVAAARAVSFSGADGEIFSSFDATQSYLVLHVYRPLTHDPGAAAAAVASVPGGANRPSLTSVFESGRQMLTPRGLADNAVVARNKRSSTASRRVQFGDDISSSDALPAQPPSRTDGSGVMSSSSSSTPLGECDASASPSMSRMHESGKRSAGSGTAGKVLPFHDLYVWNGKSAPPSVLEAVNAAATKLEKRLSSNAGPVLRVLLFRQPKVLFSALYTVDLDAFTTTGALANPSTGRLRENHLLHGIITQLKVLRANAESKRDSSLSGSSPSSGAGGASSSLVAATTDGRASSTLSCASDVLKPSATSEGDVISSDGTSGGLGSGLGQQSEPAIHNLGRTASSSGAKRDKRSSHKKTRTGSKRSNSSTSSSSSSSSAPPSAPSLSATSTHLSVSSGGGGRSRDPSKPKLGDTSKVSVFSKSSPSMSGLMGSSTAPNAPGRSGTAAGGLRINLAFLNDDDDSSGGGAGGGGGGAGGGAGGGGGGGGADTSSSTHPAVPPLGASSGKLVIPPLKSSKVPGLALKPADPPSSTGDVSLPPADPLPRSNSADHNFALSLPDKKSAKGSGGGSGDDDGDGDGDGGDWTVLDWKGRLRYFDPRISEIYPDFLYLGSETVSKNLELLQKHKITHILNAAGSICTVWFPEYFTYRTMFLLDGTSEDLQCVFHDALDFINSVFDATPRGRVFVHCQQGVSRSSAMAILWLMWKKNQEYGPTHEAVKKVRDTASPNAGFCSALLAWWRLRLTLPGPRLFRVQPHSVQDPSIVPKLIRTPSWHSTQLNSEQCFILEDPVKVYLWRGSACPDALWSHMMDVTLPRFLRYEPSFPRREHWVEIKEGQEPDAFWSFFEGGGGEVSAKAPELEVRPAIAAPNPGIRRPDGPDGPVVPPAGSLNASPTTPSNGTTSKSAPGSGHRSSGKDHGRRDKKDSVSSGSSSSDKDKPAADKAEKKHKKSAAASAASSSEKKAKKSASKSKQLV